MRDISTDGRASHRRALSYIDASRTFYAAHGYEQPYQWAVHDEAPFQALATPLAEARIGVVTTAFPTGLTGPKQAMTVPSSPVPEAMFTKDLSWHKDATHTDDIDTFLPLRALDRAEGRVGSVAERFYCVPTEYSQRATRNDAETVARWCAEDGVDAVVLVPL